jgi:hypothetical protein
VFPQPRIDIAAATDGRLQGFELSPYVHAYENAATEAFDESRGVARAKQAAREPVHAHCVPAPPPRARWARPAEPCARGSRRRRSWWRR